MGKSLKKTEETEKTEDKVLKSTEENGKIEDKVAEGTEEKKKIKDKIEKRIYIGPTIAGIFSGTIFEGNKYPVYLEKALEEHPEIKNLLVTVDSELAKKKANLNIKGTKENIFLNILKNKK